MVNDPVAFACLTEEQAWTIRLFWDLSRDGKRPSVRSVAQALGKNPNALRKTLRLARQKFAA